MTTCLANTLATTRHRRQHSVLRSPVQPLLLPSCLPGPNSTALVLFSSSSSSVLLLRLPSFPHPRRSSSSLPHRHHPRRRNHPPGLPSHLTHLIVFITHSRSANPTPVPAPRVEHPSLETLCAPTWSLSTIQIQALIGSNFTPYSKGIAFEYPIIADAGLRHSDGSELSNRPFIPPTIATSVGTQFLITTAFT